MSSGRILFGAFMLDARRDEGRHQRIFDLGNRGLPNRVATSARDLVSQASLQRVARRSIPPTCVRQRAESSSRASHSDLFITGFRTEFGTRGTVSESHLRFNGTSDG
jgi:hypothetical protein